MDIWQILMTPFSWLLKLFCEVFNSYAIALFVFALVVKLILFPFSLKGKKSMIKMNLVSSQVKEIQKRCGNDRERYNRELQEFYAKNNVSPMSGCGWTMLPMLILFPLYAIIRRPMKYMMRLTDTAIASVAGALGWATKKGSEYVAGQGYNELVLASWINKENLATATAAAGATGLFVINFNFLGLDLSQVPSWKFWQGGMSWSSFGLFLLPVISAVLSLVSSIVVNKTNAMTQTNQDAAAASTNRTMLIMSPVLSLWIGFAMPAGLCIYWIANSLLQMVQELICAKILRKDYEAARIEAEEMARKEKEAEKERRRIAAEKKAAAIAANKGKAKKVQPQSKVKGTDLSASREGIRAYARGRAYDPNRYPITPYNDPDAKLKKKEEELEPLTEEEKEILAENGIPIPEELEAVTEAAEAEETAEAAQEESAAPAQETAQPAQDDGDYEAPYAEDDRQDPQT